MTELLQGIGFAVVLYGVFRLLGFVLNSRGINRDSEGKAYTDGPWGETEQEMMRRTDPHSAYVHTEQERNRKEG